MSQMGIPTIEYEIKSITTNNECDLPNPSDLKKLFEELVEGRKEGHYHITTYQNNNEIALILDASYKSPDLCEYLNKKGFETYLSEDDIVSIKIHPDKFLDFLKKL